MKTLNLLGSVQLEIAKVLVVVTCDLKAEVRHCIKNNKKLLAFIFTKICLDKTATHQTILFRSIFAQVKSNKRRSIGTKTAKETKSWEFSKIQVRSKIKLNYKSNFTNGAFLDK